MFNKVLGSVLLSSSQKAARRNSAAIFDALEALSVIAPKTCGVSRITLDVAKKIYFRADNTKLIGPFVGENIQDLLLRGEDDSSETEPWLLIFEAARYFEQIVMSEASNSETRIVATEHREFPEGKVDLSIRYAFERSDKLGFEKAIREEYEKKVLWREKGTRITRTLVARLNPSREVQSQRLNFEVQSPCVVRYFSAELYRNMYKTLVLMEENLESDCSDEELAVLINEKNTNPRFLRDRNEPIVESVNQFCEWY